MDFHTFPYTLHRSTRNHVDFRGSMLCVSSQGIWETLENLGTIQISTDFHDLRCEFPCGFFTEKNSWCFRWTVEKLSRREILESLNCKQSLVYPPTTPSMELSPNNKVAITNINISSCISYILFYKVVFPFKVSKIR